MATVDKSMKSLIISEPFYGDFLLSTQKTLTDEPTNFVRNGVNINLNLNVNDWESTTNDLQKAMLQKFAMLLLMKAPLLYGKCGNVDAFYAACDCAINPEIPAYNNSNNVLPSQFGFDTGKTIEEYYELLVDNDECPEYDNPYKDESPDLIISPFYVGGWEDFRTIPEEEYVLLDTQIDYIAKSTAETIARGCGSVPGIFKSYIDMLFKEKPAFFNWKAAFKRMLGSVYDVSLRSTRYKENVRFPDAAGIKHNKKVRIMVAVDTSGSVADNELEDFFSEINHIYKAGAEIRLIQFDHAIQSDEEYKGHFDGKIFGRGGTTYDHLQAIYNAEHKDYDALVIFTDGGAPVNHLEFYGKVIWVITSQGIKDAKYPGAVIFIPEKA